MATSSSRQSLDRILERSEHRIAFDALIGLSGSDLTSLLLAVAARRAESVSAADVMRQRATDRFVAPSVVDAVQIARLELLALETAAERFDPIALAPVAPLGTHFSLGATPQNNVVTTARLSEVTADPTNSLALEAALLRRALLHADPRSDEVIRLSAAHRVTRAQRFDGPRSFAHFSLLGLVTAGRDRGGHQFEIESLVEQADMLAAVVHTATGFAIEIKLTAFNDDLASACGEVCDAKTTTGVAWSLDPDRSHGRGYYRNLCFKLHAAVDDELVEIGDGGDVGWAQKLMQNRKERLVIGGRGLERLAMI